MAIIIKKAVFKLQDVMTFGQYKGSTIEDVIFSDPNYLRWALKKLDWFDMDAEARSALDESQDAERLDEKYSDWMGDPYNDN
jgi:hypothetical protein